MLRGPTVRTSASLMSVRHMSAPPTARVLAARAMIGVEQVHEVIRDKYLAYKRDHLTQVAKEIDSTKLLVIGMKQNPFVKRARQLLDGEKLDYKYIEHGSYTSGWGDRMAVKIFSGYLHYPQVYSEGRLLGGWTELVRLQKKGTLKATLAEPRDAAVSAAPTAGQRPALTLKSVHPTFHKIYSSLSNRFHFVEQAREAIARDKVVIVGFNNRNTDSTTKIFDEMKVPYTLMKHGGYFKIKEWIDREAVKAWSGWPTYPQVFINGRLVGGGSDVREHAEKGRLKAMLEEPRVETPEIKYL